MIPKQVVWESLAGVLKLESKMDKDRSDTHTGGGARAAYATSEVRRERLLGRGRRRPGNRLGVCLDAGRERPAPDARRGGTAQASAPT